MSQIIPPVVVIERDYISRPNWVWVCVSIGVMMAALDGTMMSIALPTIAKSLQTSLQDTQWVMLAYMLSISVLLLPVGRLSQHYGEHRLYVLGVGLYGLAAICCGFCQNVGMLIACRLLQGVGASMLMALGPVMLSQVFGRQLGRPMAGLNITVALASVIAPLLAGWVLAHWDWHWLFWMSLPISTTGVILGTIVLKPWTEHSALGCEPFDWCGSLASMLMLGSMLFLLTYGLKRPDLWVLNTGLTMLCLVSMGWFFRHIHAYANPILSLAALKDRAVQVTCLSSFVVFGATFVMCFLLPFYLQESLGLTPTVVGYCLIAFPAGLAMTASLAGTLSDRYGSNMLGLLSMLGLAATTLWMLCFSATTPIWLIVLQQFVFGLFSGFFHAPNNRALVIALEESGSVSLSGGALALVRTLGNAFGVTMIGLVFLAAGGELSVANGAFFTAMSWSVGLSAVAIIPIILLQWRFSRNLQQVPMTVEIKDAA